MFISALNFSALIAHTVWCKVCFGIDRSRLAPGWRGDRVVGTRTDQCCSVSGIVLSILQCVWDCPIDTAVCLGLSHLYCSVSGIVLSILQCVWDCPVNTAVCLGLSYQYCSVSGIVLQCVWGCLVNTAVCLGLSCQHCSVSGIVHSRSHLSPFPLEKRNK